MTDDKFSGAVLSFEGACGAVPPSDIGDPLLKLTVYR
jgi:hypothetical protein